MEGRDPLAGSTLRCGYTTGASAAAAALAAACILTGKPSPQAVTLELEGGGLLVIPIESAGGDSRRAQASVVKESGDDPDITHGMRVEVILQPLPGDGLFFAAGPGVGVVTLPGLQVAVGEPAINPGPRRMIAAAVRSVTGSGMRVTVAIPGGEALAEKTFNPRLGIVGGLSVLGTTGILRPYSHSALREALCCGLDVALASGFTRLVLVPGNIGRRAAVKYTSLPATQIIEVSNEWGFMLDQAATRSPEAILLLGHPGKLAKLAVGVWDTHSSRSASATPLVEGFAKELAGGEWPAGSTTVQGIFDRLSEETQRTLGDTLASLILSSVSTRMGNRISLAVVLVGMDGRPLGEAGEVAGWRRGQ